MATILRIMGVDVDTRERRTPEGVLIERANNANDQGDVRGLKPGTSCFGCIHLRTLSDACALLARSTRVSTLEAVIDHRSSSDPHDECRVAEMAAPEEIERRRRLWTR